MEVSVTIPVYNAAEYVEKAVKSALNQPEVKEIILFEDGSTDGSSEICDNLSRTYNRVVTYRHKGGINRGTSASRNEAIKRAKYRFIAFLDADDYYFDNRFVETKKIFQKNSNIDGVYEVVGAHYYSEKAREKHLQRMKETKKYYTKCSIPLQDTGVESGIPADDLFSELVRNKKGWIHINGLTIKKDSLRNMKLFYKEENWTPYDFEDTEFMLRLAYKQKLVSTGSINSVASRGVHESNRILSNYKKRTTLWESIFLMVYQGGCSPEIFKKIFNHYLDNSSNYLFECENIVLRKLFKFQIAFFSCFRYPKILLKLF
jgi:glycosyltransferase involved in cell wall biosynthesis